MLRAEAHPEVGTIPGWGMVGACALLSPWLDLSCENDSNKNLASVDPLLHEDLGFPILDMTSAGVISHHAFSWAHKGHCHLLTFRIGVVVVALYPQEGT